jgi:cell wall assembly regulator SMI1
MSEKTALEGAFESLWNAVRQWSPALAARLPPIVISELPELSDLAGEPRYWLRDGEEWAPSPQVGVVAGLALLGVDGCRRERAKWASLPRYAGDPKVIDMPFGRYRSHPPGAVRDIYFSVDWFPLLVEPMEASYLAVDMDPDTAGHRGQIIVCGRDEEEHAVVAPDAVALIERLAEQARSGEWIEERGSARHRGGRLIAALVRSTGADR